MTLTDIWKFLCCSGHQPFGTAARKKISWTTYYGTNPMSHAFFDHFFLCEANSNPEATAMKKTVMILRCKCRVFCFGWIPDLNRNSRKKKTRPDTQLPKSRAGGQGLYLRSLDHLGRSSEAKDRKKPKKVKCDGRTNGRTEDRRTDKADCRVA